MKDRVAPVIAAFIWLLAGAAILAWLLGTFGVGMSYLQALAALTLVRVFLSPWQPPKSERKS